MVVKQVFDLSLRESGKRFITSLKASNRYSEGYLTSLETTVAMAALYAEEQGWPVVREITTDHIEDYLAYLQGRTRWFGTRENLVPPKLSKGHINAQYRRLNRFFTWLVERGYIEVNPLRLIKPPSLDEKTVPVVSEDQMRDLLILTNPALAKTPAHRFRLVRNQAVLYMLFDTPGLDFTQNPGKVMDDITFVCSHWWLVSEGFSLSTTNSDVQKLPATLYHRIADSLAYAA